MQAVTGGDEMYIGQSVQYNRNQMILFINIVIISLYNQIGPKTMLQCLILSCCLDVRALEYAVYRLTYGEENLPPEEPGGVTVAYPLDRMREECAFIAYHFHWALEEIINLPQRKS